MTLHALTAMARKGNTPSMLISCHSIHSQDHIHNIQAQRSHNARDHIRRCCKEEQDQLQLQQQVQLPSFHSNDHSQDHNHSQDVPDQHSHSVPDQHSHSVPDQHIHSVRDHSHRCCTEELGQLQLLPLVQLQLHACHSSDHIQAHGGHIHIHNA